MSDPTGEALDAVGRALAPWAWMETPSMPRGVITTRMATRDRQASRLDADRLLASTDPAVHAAMLDALTRHGVLEEQRGREVRWVNSTTRPGRIDEEQRRKYLGPWVPVA